MDNEDMMTALVNQSSEMEKALRQMRAKYTFDTREGDLQQIFEQDAKEWAAWNKLRNG